MSLPYSYEVLIRITVVGDGLHADDNGAMATVHKIAAAIENANIPNVADVSAFPASIAYMGKVDR